MGLFRYHLPWDLLLRDMENCGGGLIHGGLATHHGAALLLLAPPGGGKSTTLSTAPEEWRVLSDDAALIWPHEEGLWMASPLPSWGMLNQSTEGPTRSLRYLDKPVPVRAMARLYQEDELRLTPLRQAITAPLLYRAFCEYPAAFLADPAYRVHFFRTAAALTKQVPCWRLDLPLRADVWPRLENLLEQPQA
jgi:SynChlorMet cassette protein ScmC